ncbi:hypothetical protein U1Q18_026633 [Sarracenia purpurea var. burkii]
MELCILIPGSSSKSHHIPGMRQSGRVTLRLPLPRDLPERQNHHLGFLRDGVSTQGAKQGRKAMRERGGGGRPEWRLVVPNCDGEGEELWRQVFR